MWIARNFHFDQNGPVTERSSRQYGNKAANNHFASSTGLCPSRVFLNFTMMSTTSVWFGS